VGDEITLTIPGDREFHRVAQLVLGGLAARLDLTIDTLDDLELALDAILDRSDSPGAELTVRLRTCGNELETLIGPLPASVLDELDRDEGPELGLRRVLESTVDDVHVDGDRVRLTKRVAHA